MVPKLNKKYEVVGEGGGERKSVSREKSTPRAWVDSQVKRRPAQQESYGRDNRCGKVVGLSDSKFRHRFVKCGVSTATYSEI